jgi:hypothetical protein
VVPAGIDPVVNCDCTPLKSSLQPYSVAPVMHADHANATVSKLVPESTVLTRSAALECIV